MRIKNIILILAIIMVVLSCGKDEITSPKTQLAGINYYPLITGTYVDYQVTEITIDKESNYYDTAVYQLRQLIDINYLDNENDTTYRIERHIATTSQSFEISDIWAAKISNKQAQIIEENIRYVKIRFPVEIDKIWNGNIYNLIDEQSYQITELNTSIEINSFVFDSVLTVTQENDSSIIHKNFCQEKYAMGIGLIYKEMIHLNSQEPQIDIPIEDRITTGTIYKQIITNYGTL